MSGNNLDKSLGEIISSRKTATRGGHRGRRGGARAPVGGIAKTVAKAASKAPTKQAAAAAAAAAIAAAPAAGNKKIMVSNLPTDVNEQQIKEYFSSRVGPVARIEINYGRNGVSRGVATIIFRGNLAQKAVEEHNGIMVDNKPMKVEVVYDAKHLPAIPAPKPLSARVADTKGGRGGKKEQPARKDGPKKVKTDGDKPGRGGKRGRGPVRKKKTAEDLDAEMADYFDVKQTGAGDGAAPAAAAPAAAAPATAAETMDEVL